ncbi:MAG: polysaccharide biosynthesis tyrosine autokinase [Coleofasciculaceae cyanobacterium]
METESVSPVFSISKRGRQLQQLPSVDKEEVNAPPQKGLNLRPLLRTIKRKAILVIGITGLVTAGAVIYSRTLPTSYKGDFRLLVEPITNEGRVVEPSAISRAQGQGSSRETSNLDYATQLEILQSPRILQDIFEQAKTKYPELNRFIFDKSFGVQRYEGANPQQAERTKLIQVTYSAKDSKEVLDVLQIAATKYLKYSLDERKTRIGEGVKFIDDQLPELQTRVETLQSQLQRLQQQYKLSDPKSQGDALFTQVRTIANDQAATQSLLQEQRALYINLQQQLNLTPDEAIAASALSQEPNYTALQARIQELDNQIAVESGRFSEESPTIRSLRAKRANLATLEAQEKSKILGQNQGGATGNPQVSSFQNAVRVGLIEQMVQANNQIKLLEVRSRELANNRAAIEGQARQFPSIARQYSDLQGQLDIATKTRDQLLTQRETLRVEAAQNQIPWELVSKPAIPTGPGGNLVAAPSKSRNIQVGGLVAGLLLGVGAAVLFEKGRNIFYVSEEIEEAIQLPLLGVIPLYRGSQQLSNSPSFVGAIEQAGGSNKSATLFREAFDSLYANIRFLFSDPAIRSLAVCSAAAGDGKSTVALHLAQTAAAMGQRVLLVDANLRQPQLHNKLNLANQKGLNDLLAKKIAPNELLGRSQVGENFFVLTAGQPFPNSTKLLASTQMQYLMEEFQATFDLVIYDTPDLTDFRDANFLATHTDGILMVVAISKTSRSAVKKVMEQLNTFRLPTLGVVANHVKKNQKISYENNTPHNLQLENDELQVRPNSEKWLDYQQEKINERKS